MKKTTVKLLSALLALVLILSAVPMMALAEETTDHVHEDVCCAEADVSVTAACTHTYQIVDVYSYQGINRDYHITKHYYRHICVNCDYTYDELLATYNESHTDSGNQVCSKCKFFPIALN